MADRRRLRGPLLQRPLGRCRPGDRDVRLQHRRRRLGDRRRHQRGLAADRCLLRAGRRRNRPVVGIQHRGSAARHLQRSRLGLERHLPSPDHLHLQRHHWIRRSHRSGHDQRRSPSRGSRHCDSRLRRQLGRRRLLLHKERNGRQRHAAGRRLPQRQEHDLLLAVRHDDVLRSDHAERERFGHRARRRHQHDHGALAGHDISLPARGPEPGPRQPGAVPHPIRIRLRADDQQHGQRRPRDRARALAPVRAPIRARTVAPAPGDRTAAPRPRL